jgi:alkylation response protein AidB-like acyl-CoA dehydrogenase
MDFKLTDEQQLMVKSLTELLQREVPESYLTECDTNHEAPSKGWKTLADNGFLALGLPEKYGGTPADALTQILVLETLGRYASPLATYYSMVFLLCHDVELFGTEEQKAKTIPAIIKGDMQLAVAITEPGAGSDDAAMTTTAEIKGDKVVINGQKTWCTNAHQADYILLVTRDVKNPEPHKALSMWLLPTNTPGVKIVQIPKMFLWTMGSCEVFLDNVVLPKTALVGELNNGWKQLMTNFGFERAGLAAMALGMAQGALDDAASYANKRVQFGKPIGSYQAIQHRIADMAMKIELMRNLTYKVAWMVDNGISVRTEASMVKLYASVALNEVVDDAIQVMGGVGVMMGSRVQRLWRDARMQRIGGGTDEMMYNAVGPTVLKQYK